MKKKIILIAAAAVLAATAVIGGTLAGYNTETPGAGSVEITTKDLGISIVDETAPAAAGLDVDACVPGETVEITPMRVTNDVEEGYDLYTRVTIYKSWDDSALDGSRIRLYQGDTALNDLQTGDVLDGWIFWYQDDEQMIFYYQNPISSGEGTSALLTAVQPDASIDNAYTDREIHLDFVIDAVQVTAAEAAMPSEWGVHPTIDENGVITSITE